MLQAEELETQGAIRVGQRAAVSVASPVLPVPPEDCQTCSMLLQQLDQIGVWLVDVFLRAPEGTVLAVTWEQR